MSISTLALANALAVDATRIAMSAIHHLDDAGCTVREIDIRNRRPVIRIEQPPINCWLRGALRKRITEHGITRTVYVTTCHGALVEWEASQHSTPEVVRA